MPIPMGIGRIGESGVFHKRKFRWTFEVDRTAQGGKSVPASFVKMAARPNLNIEETEINFLNGKIFVPGKGTWETITITYYDVSVNAGEDNIALWEWLASVYDFTNHVNLYQSSDRACYGGVAKCKLYDGCGNTLETWKLNDCWPQAVNFGELDYGSNDEVTIEVTLRYAKVSYMNNCGEMFNAKCCGCKKSNDTEPAG